MYNKVKKCLESVGYEFKEFVQRTCTFEWVSG